MLEMFILVEFSFRISISSHESDALFIFVIFIIALTIPPTCDEKNSKEC